MSRFPPDSPALPGPGAGAANADAAEAARRLERTEAERDEALRQAIFVEQQRDIARDMALRFEREADALRRDFAHLLNDDLARHATALKTLASTFESRLAGREPSLAQLASLMMQSTDAMLAAIRDSITRIRADSSAGNGLPDGLRALVEDWRLRRPDMRFELLLEPADDSEFGLGSSALETAAVRLVAHALGNAVDHARAAMVVVSARRTGARLTLQISDDGRGLPRGDIAEGPGLRAMRELVVRLGGSLLVDTGESGGAEVLVELPWP
jgi:glucose-6-phosphate-specific signal transduction histidine kinase